MNVDRLIEKLLCIEALHAGATTDGERMAAEEARTRILARLEQMKDEPVELYFHLSSRWAVQLFTALARRYGLKPYRYRGQRRTTRVLKIKRRFLDETFWPQFEALSAELNRYLDEVAQSVIERAVHGDVSEASLVAEPKQLVMPTG